MYNLVVCLYNLSMCNVVAQDASHPTVRGVNSGWEQLTMCTIYSPAASAHLQFREGDSEAPVLHSVLMQASMMSLYQSVSESGRKTHRRPLR